MDATKFIITREEAIREIDHDVKDEVNLLDLIESATAEIELALGRTLVTPTSITEYHELLWADSEIQLIQRPIIAVTSVHESSTQTYDSTTLLTEGTDFEVRKDSGILIRKSGSSKTNWLVDRSAIEPEKVIYTAGYATQSVVPADIKKICREYVAMMYRDIAERLQNQENVSDGFGSFRRFGPPMLTSEMKKRLLVHRNISIGGSTSTRSEAA